MIGDNEVTIIRDEPVTEKKINVPTTPVSADELREIYLNKVNLFINKLRHSTNKKYDPAPSPAALQNEISRQNAIIEQIIFLQNCRSAIEQAVEYGRGEVWRETSMMAFVRQEDGLILAMSLRQLRNDP